MSTWLVIAALTFSSSIDNLGVGLSYGIRNIRINLIKNLVISIICFLFSVTGIYFGLWISNILPGVLPIVIGGIFLVIFGIRIMLLAIPHKNMTNDKQSGPGRTKSNAKNTASNDLDIIQNISFGEAVVLGIALSANALTNGVGAGLLGISPLFISILNAIGSFVCVWIGVTFGMRLTHIRIGKFTVGQFGTLISGILLILIAVMFFFDFQ